MISSFLMIGQSNMAGRGFLEEVPPISDSHILMLRNGLWMEMAEPVCNDFTDAGTGLAPAFAQAWTKEHEGEYLGLIPCAHGGTSLNEWKPGRQLADHAVALSKLAQRISRIEGILWHQGENDAGSLKLIARYPEKFEKLLAYLRKELNLPEVPVVIGGIGEFIRGNNYDPAYGYYYPELNHMLQTFAEQHENVYYVTSKGLTANPDQLHFNAVSLRKLGRRYYTAYKERRNVLEPLKNEDGIK